MKAVALYFALVVVPLLGVFGVLQLGKLAEPPPSIGGVWRVTEGALCSVPDRAFSIDQSGAFLHLRLPGRMDLPVRLIGDSFEAEGGATAEVSPGCSSDAVRVEARVGKDVAERITGRMGIPGCGGCPMRPFVAVRDTAAGARAALAPNGGH